MASARLREILLRSSLKHLLPVSLTVKLKLMALTWAARTINVSKIPICLITICININIIQTQSKLSNFKDSYDFYVH